MFWLTVILGSGNIWMLTSSAKLHIFPQMHCNKFPSSSTLTGDNTKNLQVYEILRGAERKPQKRQHKSIKVLIHEFGAARQSCLITSSRGRDGSKVSHPTFFPSSCPPLLLSPPPQNLSKCQTDLRSRLFQPSISVGGRTLQDFLT